MRKSYPNYKKKNGFSKESSIGYECKGRGHIANDYDNKKSKYKLKGKAMATTWDDESKTSEHESQSSKEALSQVNKAFMVFGTPMSLLLETSYSSEDDGEYEEEDIYDAQEAFDDLFMQSVELRRKNKQLKRKIIELAKKVKIPRRHYLHS